MEQMRDEGIGFEITYSPALQSRDDRRAVIFLYFDQKIFQVLANGRRVVRALKCKGIIVSSAAESVIDLRAPVDVMNMLRLWDVDGAHARPMISRSSYFITWLWILFQLLLGQFFTELKLVEPSKEPYMLPNLKKILMVNPKQTFRTSRTIN